MNPLFRLSRDLIVGLVLLSFAAPLRAQATEFNGVTVPGVVIAHSPKSSGVWYASPALAILPDGDYVASHDVSMAKRTLIYRSSDRGKNWHLISTVEGQGFSNLFVHRGGLYLMGTTGGMGSLAIRRSTDGGQTWTMPTDAATGLLKPQTKQFFYHTAPVPVVIAQGRIWRGYESYLADPHRRNVFGAGVMSARVDADLLNAANWMFTNELNSDPAWLPHRGFKSWREGTVVVDRDGSVLDMIRVDVPKGASEKAAILRVQNPNVLSFDPSKDLIDFNGGAKKFTIRYAPKTDRYYAIVSLITDENRDSSVLPSSHRNIAAIVESQDLHHWLVKRVVLKDLSDMAHIGFQYWDWQFDGDDIVAVSRTAFPDGLGGARRFHDANFLTFHRFENILTPTQHGTPSRPAWRATTSG